MLSHDFRSQCVALTAALAATCLGGTAQEAQAQCQLDESAKLLASDPAGNDRFGNSIAIYGDTAVIGADWDDHAGGNNAGSAYVFVHSGGVWTEQTKLTASDAAAGDIFGASVSVFGNTAVIGADLDDHAGGTDAGAAYVFVRSDGVWTEQTKLTASDAAGGDYFGYSVSVSGDTAVVGAFYHDHAGGSDAGAAYVFVRSGGVWSEQAKLTASDAAADDRFGWSVSISGDTAVIGAHFADPAGVSKAGAAYVFVRSGAVWTQQAKLTASDGAADDFFGCSVVVSDETVLIGASGDDHAGGNGAGAAYVFVKPGGGWVDMTETAKLTASDAAAMDGFGHCCSVSADTAVIGAFGDDHTGEANAGSAYVFVRSGGVWTERAKLVASDAAADDRFGISVCVSGGTAVIGADTDDHAGGTDAGAAYVFGGLGDCNANGVPDDCDIALGTSADCQLDGLPDECQVEGILLPFTDPAPLNNNAATDSGADYLPQVATDGTGNWVAVWRSDDDLGPGLGTDRDILVARSVDNGATWTDPAPLNNNAATDSGADECPQATTDGAGNWVAVWYSDDDLGSGLGTDYDILFACSVDNGVTWTDPAPLNDNAAMDSGDDVRPQISTDGAGNWVAVWYSDDDLGVGLGSDSDILVARSVDNGVTWTDPAPLNNNATTDSGGDSLPQVITDGAGNWVAAWYSYDDLGVGLGTDWDILFARSVDNGVTWTDPAPLNSNAATDSGSDTVAQVTTDGAGNWVAVWESYDDLGAGLGTDSDILVARSADDGVTWTDPAPLNNDAAADSGYDLFPQVTTDDAGNWVAVWQSGKDLGAGLGTDSDILFARVAGVPPARDCNANGVPDECDLDAGTSADCNTNGIPDECDIAGATSEDCNANGVPDNCDIALGTSADCQLDGLPDECQVEGVLLPFTDPAPLNNNAGTDTGSDSLPQVTTDGAGNWVAVWESYDDLGAGLGTDRDILVTRSVDDGITWTDPAPLNNNAFTDAGYDVLPQVTTDGVGNWVAVWSSSEDLGGIGTDLDVLVARSVDNGLTWTDPAPLNNNAATDSGDDWTPDVTRDGAGNWVAVWASYEDLGGIGTDLDILVARSVDNGVTWTDPAPLNNNAATDSMWDAAPHVTTDGAGNWVAIWPSPEELGGIGTDPDILFARSEDNGATWTDPAPLNNNAATDWALDLNSHVTSDGAGNWVAVWSSTLTDSDILVARSADNGVTWSDPAPLNNNAATDSGDDEFPQVTTDGGGNWVAVWFSYDDLGAGLGTDTDILVAHSADNGVTWSDPAPLNNNAATDSGHDSRPHVATDGGGNWVAVWQSDEDLGAGLGTDYDILVARVGSVPPAQDCNANGVPDECDLDAGTSADCNTNGVPDECDIAQGTSADCQPDGVPDECQLEGVHLSFTDPGPLNNNAAMDVGEDEDPQVTTDGAGNWVAVWHSEDDLGAGLGTDWDILLARSTDDGLTWTDPAPLNNNAATDLGDDRAPQVTTDGAGNWVAVWHSYNDPDTGLGIDADILVARSTDDGVTWTDPAPLNNDAGTDLGNDIFPQVTTDCAGNWVAAWHSSAIDWDILTARSVDNGVTWTDPAPLNNNAATDSGSDVSPQLATDGAGNWVAVWTSDDDLGVGLGTDCDILLARSWDNGATWTDPAALNNNATTDSGFDARPQVTTDGAGNWVAVWFSYDDLGGTIGLDSDILVARSVNNGVTWTAPAPVNNNAATDSEGDGYPQVETDGAGNWVAVWHSSNDLGAGLGTDYDILVARSMDAGVTWTDPAPLNNNAAADSGGDYDPQVTTDSAGNWVAVWQSADDLGAGLGADYDILVARMDSAPPALDCNGNGVPDECDIAGATSEDCNTNGVPDECDTGAGMSPDCNANGVPDECDIAQGTSIDCQPDGFPDECQLDGVHVPFTDSQPLNNNAATDSGEDRYPQVTTDGAGNWVAVWHSDDDLGIGLSTDYDILVARSVDNGVTWTDPAPLNNNAAIDSGEDEYPQITTDGAGNWVAVWQSDDDLGAGLGTDGDILVARSVDNGVTWTDPAPLNNNAATDSGDDARAHLSTDGAGYWVATWESNDDLGAGLGADNDILVARSTDNGATWTDPAPLNNNAATDSGGDYYGRVTTDGAGNWVATWESKDDLGAGLGTDFDILVARSTDNGVTWTDPAPLNNNAATDSGGDSIGQVTTDRAGNWVAVWQSGDDLGAGLGTDYDILVARSTDNGVTWTNPAPLNNNAATDSGHDYSPELATDGAGNWVAVWQSGDDLGAGLGTDYDILVAGSTDNGATWTDPAPLNNNAATDSGGDYWAQVATDGTGNWVAVWYSNDDLGAGIGTDYDILVARMDSAPPALDCNANDVPDECDIAGVTSEDCNTNGVPDECDIAEGTSTDCQPDGVPDECEPDCNGNGVADECDIYAGTSTDCNNNGVPDLCDIDDETSADCNNNNVPDECDIAAGTSQDANVNGVPDECEFDCLSAELVKLLASDPAAGDYFGWLVSVSGDTAVIGAGWDDHAGNIDAGSAYVFVRSGAVWTEQAKLTASDAAAYDYFGSSVCVSGDTAVIGARGDDPGGIEAGSAYVFVRSGGVWTEQAKLTASDGEAGDWFGGSVSISGDTVVIGALWEDHPGGIDDAGSAYVFVRSGSVWTEHAKLTASDAATEAYFSVSISVSGDTAVIGAHRDDHAGGNDDAGGAYVFVKPGGGWVDMTETAKLTASDAAAGDLFGGSVCVSGDTAVIGAHFDDHVGGTEVGSAYVFVRTGEVWAQQAKLTASDAEAWDHFGRSVSVSGETAVIGASWEGEPGAYQAGAAYVFARSGGMWTEQVKLKASDAAADDWLGSSVSVCGDTALIGAFGDDRTGEIDAGSVYVFAGLGDCNTNGIMDTCDIDAGTSADCNANGVPDECEAMVDGDFDADGDVDVDDYEAFEDCLAGPGVAPDPAAPECVNACLDAFDFEPDGDVDLLDFAEFQEAFTGPDWAPPFMVRMPGGEFEMGCHAETGETCSSDELPVHTVYVDAFYMDIYEVTTQKYCDYLNSAYSLSLIEVSSGNVYKAGDSELYCVTTASTAQSRITWNGSTFGITAGKEDHPMTHVTWYGAVAYANWRSAEHGRTPCYDLATWDCNFAADGYRLPTEAEWEFAARGGEHDPYYAYPWGNGIDGSNANYSMSGDPYETGDQPWTTPVGYYDGGQIPAGSDMANGYGLYDVAGNVWEWCNDRYGATYYSSSPYDNPQGPATGTYRVLRGGSWGHGVSYLRCAVRYDLGPAVQGGPCGFRLAGGM